MDKKEGKTDKTAGDEEPSKKKRKPNAGGAGKTGAAGKTAAGKSGAAGKAAGVKINPMNRFDRKAKAVVSGLKVFKV